jgi:hypothetical protein
MWGHIRQPPPYTVPLISYVSSYVLKNKAFKTVQKRPQNRGHTARCPCPLRASVISHYYHQASLGGGSHIPVATSYLRPLAPSPLPTPHFPRASPAAFRQARRALRGGAAALLLSAALPGGSHIPLAESYLTRRVSVRGRLHMQVQTAAGGWAIPPVQALVCGVHLSPPEARPPTSGGVVGMASLRSLPGGSQKPLFGSYLRSVQGP